jgi:hypothetical protein
MIGLDGGRGAFRSTNLTTQNHPGREGLEPIDPRGS